MASPFTSVSVTRSYEQIVRKIQDAIRSGALPRGGKLPTERELAESFGVSRSVVREAVKVLAAHGIVESRQGAGTFVIESSAPFVSKTIMLDVPLDHASIEQLIEFRENLDALSARLAAERRTDDLATQIQAAADDTAHAARIDSLEIFQEADLRFHRLIDEASANVYIAIASNSVRQAQNEAVHLFAEDKGSFGVASEQHRSIASAIRRHAADEAEQLMRDHVRYAGSFLLKIADGSRSVSRSPT